LQSHDLKLAYNLYEYIYCHLQGDMDRFAVSWVPTTGDVS